ncbi:MAG: ABC transporter ATP-binding protein [Salinivirgaceae bacterium]|nr:ABC transporter ATP-binding protein [Salinivirgaceae bacterium]
MLKVENLHIKLGDFHLSDINFSVEKGEYFMLLGESGSGKSVLLESIAGLFKQNKGEIFLNGQNINKTNIQKRKIGLVFQDFALFPHYSVEENIAFPLKIRKYKSAIIKDIVDQLACEMNILPLLKRKPETLSGGEKQRVALARTLTLKPDILLLDEPLSSIDVSLKGELRSLLRRLNQKGQTIIHVTHDYEEAISLASKIAIIQDGKIVQTGTPKEVFTHPKNKFVAHFGGIKNFYEAKLEADPGKETTKACINEYISFQILTKHHEKKGHVLIGQKNILLSLVPQHISTINQYKGTIKEIIPARMGVDLIVETGVDFYVSVTSDSVKTFNYAEGQEVWVAFNPSAVKFIPD